MELNTSAGGNSWNIMPENAVAGVVLAVLFLYFFVRHFIFVLMVFDMVLGWLRHFRWFPNEGKRMSAFVHWIIALALFLGFLVVGGAAGWLEYTPI
ncbi:MAG: hypothetical protein AAFP16_07325 [Pseudomonadota bacterium]